MNKYYEDYPTGIICLSAALTILSYALGALILYMLDTLLGASYIILCLISLLASMKFRCSFCYYYGKNCYTGLGKPAKLLFRKGSSNDFKNPKNLIPAAILSFAVLLLPIIAAIFLLFTKFSWSILILFGCYVIIAVIPGFVLRKDLFCKYCKQGKIGCPAYEGMKGKNR